MSTTKGTRPIDANNLARRIREYMDDFPNATTRLATCRAILSMLGDEKQTPTLRPVSREQVEKVWGSGGWETVPDKGFVDTAGRQVYHLHCPHCGFFWRETDHAKYFRFCPACGAPMTDKAVDMAMERLEVLRDE